MGDFNQFYKARNTIKDIIWKDLIGPVNDNEILIEPPTQYYTMGKLYPNNQDVDMLDISRTAAIESEADTYDISLSSTNMRNPSSMGITVTLKPIVDEININLKFAVYELNNLEDIKRKNLKISECDDNRRDNTVFWVRKAFDITEKLDIGHSKSIEVIQDVFLRVYKHKTFDSGEVILTIVLMNNKTNQNDFVETNKNTIFQPVIRIFSTDEMNKNIFTNVLRQVELEEDPELLEMDLLYRDYRCFAQGHGCSVIWDIKQNNEPEYVESTFMPQYNLLQMRAEKFNDLPIFQMHYLANADQSEIIDNLRLFADKYTEWIVRRQEEIAYIPKRLQQSAQENMKKCISARDRIENGILLLEDSAKSDGLAWHSFKYANEAMYIQRCRTKILNGDMIESEKITWYPFQLAFFLQELGSLIEPESDDRKLVDLLWFPTGGGKTEAYLGIAAFAIFFRRLKFMEAGNGVTVIMRYTLRLLTIQQFERASSLICACEILRQKYNIIGDRISIGLWVGNEMTPGSIEKASVSLDKLKVGASLNSDEANPCQIKICPWCGNELTLNNYKIDKVNKRMKIICSKKECNFGTEHNPLPISLIDEEIYSHKPSFIVATIDKFAQITLKQEPAVLFGVNTGTLPPDLIIQDELHLISGPLGTMTGIYEAAITRICIRANVPIKIIASTATIRNASNQILSLYGQDYSQFPPKGLSIDDSFFAKKSTEEESPARLYLGCMGVGTTFTTTLIRVYAAWLFSSRYLASIGEYDDEIVDNFWTLIGYFNSLRELGGARTQVVDDVQSRYKYLKDKKFAHLIPPFNGRENYAYSEELTSRMGNAEISEIIQKGLKRKYKHDNFDDVYDFILASNMISVGVDVGRLGTMAVAGQPKTNAEYIQATSRVGRENPGLVMMIYNASRSRDRSHYEQFMRYHSALYRYVEATSLTPFSERARDRGLQALFVAMSRYMIDSLRQNDQAANFKPDSSEIQEIEKLIYEYVQRVDAKELDNVINEIQSIKDLWQQETGGTLYYKHKGKKSLLKPDTNESDRFRTMNSMRSVEKQSGIYLLG